MYGVQPDWVQIGLLIVAIVTVIVSTCNSNKAIKYSVNSALLQSKAQLFAEYTRRYQDIMLKMPTTMYSEIAKPTDENIRPYMIMYFDLCSEEYYLYKSNLISKEVWDMWQDGMRYNMRKPIYKTSWQNLKCEYNDKFKIFFEGQILNK